MAQECKIASSETFHSGESCCSIIYGRKCSAKILGDLQTPLENTYPEIFGKLDEEQELLIKSGSKPVVVVENASEFVSQMKNVYGFIEQIIDYIIRDNKKKYVFLGSHTVPLVIKQKWLDKYPFTHYDSIYELTVPDDNRRIKYDELVGNIKPKKIPNQAILHIGADLEEAGHYGIAIKNGKKVIVFDSMQWLGKSAYTAIFSQFAQEIFEIEPTVLFYPDRQTCPQPTGGFVNREPEETDEKYLVKLQNLDSQNHFCYLWAIWYFHVFITQGEEGIENIFQELSREFIPPLVVIKRYIWSILHSFYPTDKKLAELLTEVISTAHEQMVDKKTIDFLTRFFMLNFRYIWDDMDTEVFQLYSVIDCDLHKFRNMANINECLKYSTEKAVYVLDKFTS
jgi:hypothetical protein